MWMRNILGAAPYAHSPVEAETVIDEFPLIFLMD